MSSDHSRHYSEQGFWDTVGRAFKSAGATVIRPALELYYAMESPETPMWAKAIAIGALGYLILPIDAVPDLCGNTEKTRFVPSITGGEEKKAGGPTSSITKNSAFPGRRRPANSKVRATTFGISIFAFLGPKP